MENREIVVENLKVKVLNVKCISKKVNYVLYQNEKKFENDIFTFETKFCVGEEILFFLFELIYFYQTKSFHLTYHQGYDGDHFLTTYEKTKGPIKEKFAEKMLESDFLRLRILTDADLTRVREFIQKIKK